MKRAMLGGFLAGIVLLVGLLVGPAIGVAGQSGMGKANPTVTVVTPVAELHKNTDIVIMGTGFESEQEVRLVVTTVDGIRSDIGARLKPEPIANESGAWITVWDCNRFVGKKLLAEGVFTITATDNEYYTLAYASVAFYDVGKPEEEWPAWAK